MPTAYTHIHCLQEPNDMGRDETGKRVKVGFNIGTWKKPSETFEEELLKILTTAGISSSQVVCSSQAVIPPSGTVLQIRATPGVGPVRTHNSVATPAYVRPSAQIVAFAETLQAARALAYDAYHALGAVRNQSITP